MKSQKLNSLLEPKKNELAELQRLLKATQNQIDDAVEQGNNALLSLSDEFEELAEALTSSKRTEDLLDVFRNNCFFSDFISALISICRLNCFSLFNFFVNEAISAFNLVRTSSTLICSSKVLPSVTSICPI